MSALGEEPTDLAQIWRDAVNEYNKHVEEDYPQYRISATTGVTSVDGPNGILAQVSKAAQGFEDYRHQGGVLVRIRTWLGAHLGWIQVICSQVGQAVAAAWPPAQAILSAMTFVIQIAGMIKADFDSLMSLFAQVGSFLNLLKILEKGLPASEPLKQSITDSMSTFLVVFGVSIRYMKKEGRAHRIWHTIVEGRDPILQNVNSRLQRTFTNLNMATGLMAVHSLTIVDVKIDVLDQKLDAIQTEQLELDKAVKGTPDRILEALAGTSAIGYMKLVEDSIAARKKENKIKVMKFFRAKQSVQTRSRPFEDHVPGTVSWLLEEDAYKKWRSMGNPVLWLHGPPGIGKAHLAYGIFSDLTSGSRLDLPGSVAFASLKVEKESTSLKMALCSFASQIAEEDSNYCDAVAEELKEMTGPRAYEELNLEDVWTKFFSTKFKKDSSSHAYLILDSPFKKADTSEVDRFGKFLAEVARDKLQLLVVVTASTESKAMYPSLEALKIEINSGVMKPDVTQLIRYRCSEITGMQNIRTFSQEIKDKIIENLGEKSMEYATLMLQHLNSVDESQADAQLDDLPTEVRDVYAERVKTCQETFLAKRKPEDKEFLRRLFGWTTFAYRYLSVTEMEAVIDSRFWKASNIQHEIQSGPSGTLLELNEDSPEAQISFQDSKLLDFFQDPRSELGALGTSASDAHLEILSQCVESLVYIEETVPAAVDTSSAQSQRGRLDPHAVLRDFAIENFANCLGTLNETDLSEQAVKKLLSLLESMQKHSAVVARKFESGADPTNVYSSLLYYLGVDDDSSEATSQKEENKEQGAADAKEERLDGEPSKEPDQPQSVTEVVETSAEDPQDLPSEPVSKWAPTWEENVQIWLERARNISPEASTTDNSVFDPSDIWKELAKEHAKSWLGSNGRAEANTRFQLARDCLRLTSYGRKLDSYGPAIKAVEEILGAFPDLSVDAQACYSIAEVLYSNYDNRYDAARSRCEGGLSTCNDGIMCLRLKILLAEILAESEEKPKECLEAAENAVTLQQKSDSIPLDDQTKPLLKRAYVLQSLSNRRLKDFRATITAYRKARNVWPEPPADLLDDLLHSLKEVKDYKAMFQLLKQCNDEDLHALLGSANWYDSTDVHEILQVASHAIDKTETVAKIYKNIVAKRDRVYPFYQLGIFQRRVARDDAEAYETFEDALDNCEDRSYGTEYTYYRIRAAFAELLWERFTSSADKVEKVSLWEKMRGLPKRGGGQSDTSALGSLYRARIQLPLARMTRKVGTAAEWQEVLQDPFQVCIDALTDSYEYNDQVALRILAKVLKSVGWMEEDAEVANSLNFSKIMKYDSEPADDDLTGGQAKVEGENGKITDKELDLEEDLTVGSYIECNGECDDTTLPGWYGKSQEAEGANAEEKEQLNEKKKVVVGFYTCLTCVDVDLCPECYGKRMRYDQGEECEFWREYCGKGHDFIRGPISGWRGVRNGLIRYGRGEGKKAVKFEDWRDGVQTRWREGWERFWKG